MNSTKKDFGDDHANVSFTPQKIEFTHRPNITCISIMRTYTMLEDIECQDLFKWGTEFIQTMKLAQWDFHAAVEVLKASIDSKYYELIEGANTAEEIMKIILKQKYLAKHYLKYLNILANVQQGDFLTKKEYREQTKYMHSSTNMYGLVRSSNRT